MRYLISSLLLLAALPFTGCATTGTTTPAVNPQAVAVIKAVAIGVIAATVKDPVQAASLENTVANLQGNFTDLCSIAKALEPLAAADPKINPAILAGVNAALAAACPSTPLALQTVKAITP